MRDFGPIFLGELGEPRGAIRPVGPPPVRPPRSRAQSGPEKQGLDELLEAAHALCGRLRALDRRGSLTGAQMTLIRALGRQEPQTVPQLARAGSVSRQHIQAVVNVLDQAGYVERVPNPAHRRSPLLRLSPRGRRVVDETLRGEAATIARLRRGVGADELRKATAVLRAVAAALPENAKV